MSSRKKREVKRKLRSLRSHHKYLKTALSEIKEELVRYEKEWSHDIGHLMKEIRAPADEEVVEFSKNSILLDDAIKKDQHSDKKIDSYEDDTVSEAKSPDWAKSLYKKIARKTHPDTLKKGDNIKEMTSIFQEAAKSMSAGNHEKLFDIAFELGINVGMSDEETAHRLSLVVSRLAHEIKEIEESFPWTWGESFGILEIRLQIAQKALVQMGVKIKDEELSKIIKFLEKEVEE